MGLTDRQREIFVRWFTGQPLDQIAVACGIQRYAVDRAVRAAVTTVAKQLQAVGEPPQAEGRARKKETAPGSGKSRRFKISPKEAQALVEQVRDRKPDFEGTGNRINPVDTSAGPAVVRVKKEEQLVTFLGIWMPENTAIEYARERGVRTPEILYAGVDSATGREFTIMQYIPGETLPFDDPDLLNWLPDLLDQVQLMSSRPVPAGLAMDIPAWQRQMIQRADYAYHGLPPSWRSKLGEVGIGPLSDYSQPDHLRSGEPVVFAHNDLYPRNLRLDEQGKVWILDWERGGPGDPLYNALSFLTRIGDQVDEATSARATEMWIERMAPVNPAVDVERVLLEYRRMEDWRGIAMTAGTTHIVAVEPYSFEGCVEWCYRRFARQPDWRDISRDEWRTMIRRWINE